MYMPRVGLGHGCTQCATVLSLSWEQQSASAHRHTVLLFHLCAARAQQWSADTCTALSGGVGALWVQVSGGSGFALWVASKNGVVASQPQKKGEH